MTSGSRTSLAHGALREDYKIEVNFSEDPILRRIRLTRRSVQSCGKIFVPDET
jgi:hypothetical protein